jgi:ribose transport system substrate-binding protein
VKLVVLDAQDDSAKMTAAMEDLIQKKVDAILVNPTDSDAVTPSILKANEAGIPVFTIDRGASGGKVVCHIASDNEAGGKDGRRIPRQDPWREGQCSGTRGHSRNLRGRDRGKGFNDAVAAFPGIKIVAAQAADFSRDRGQGLREHSAGPAGHRGCLRPQ